MYNLNLSLRPLFLFLYIYLHTIEAWESHFYFYNSVGIYAIAPIFFVSSFVIHTAVLAHFPLDVM